MTIILAIITAGVSSLLFLLSAPLVAQQEVSLSAWDVFIMEDPALIREASPLEREALQLMLPAQARKYLAGSSANDIILITGEPLRDFLVRKGSNIFDIFWHSIDNGGGIASMGGDFALSGTIGQPDARPMSGGDFIFTGGFWSHTLSPEIDPCDDESTLFCDSFETGDTSRWFTTQGG